MGNRYEYETVQDGYVIYGRDGKKMDPRSVTLSLGELARYENNYTDTIANLTADMNQESWTGLPEERMLRLHLGAGARKLPGYTSVDIRPEVDPDIVADIERLDEFKNASAEVIYAAHVLEHIPRPHILTVLEEWRRVLRPGGTLRLSVPDFKVLAELYLYDDVSMWRITGPLHGRQDYEANTHYISFDYEYLAWMLGTAGYHDIRRWQPWVDHPTDYDDISLAKIDGEFISLNVEATA